MSDVLKQRARQLRETMRCNCDLDNWVPEPETGHSWVCRIHKYVMNEHRYGKAKALQPAEGK
jgi:hypothetical protein